MTTKRAFSSVLMAMLAVLLHAQESQTVFNFLRLPVSAHAAALGGENISLTDDDATLVFHNPALLTNVSDRSLGLNMMTYMEGAVTGSASYSQTLGERASWGVQGRFINFGKMKETTYDNQDLGTFHANDFALGGTFAYRLSDYFSGGVTAKFVASYIASYSSTGAAVDLGLNYYNPDSEWSIGAAVRNLGGQLSAYEEEFERMPIDLQLGVTKRLVGSPLRFSAALVRLNDWEYGIGRHLVFGADLLLSEQIYVAFGYNAMRASEMKIKAGEEDESNHGAALSLGAGLTLERLKLHVSYGKYHVSSTSLMINFSYTL